MAITHPACDETLSLIAARTDTRAALTEAGDNAIINQLTITPATPGTYVVQSPTGRVYVHVRNRRNGTSLTLPGIFPSRSRLWNRATRLDLATVVATLKETR